MSNIATAADAGRFRIGGDLGINRLGFGAMRIMRPGYWSEPPNRPEVLRTLRRLPELAVDFVDTADCYGPEVSEKLIREALYPYGEIRIATKAGLTRPGPDQWEVCGKPEHLIRQANRSRELLGIDCIDLWQLHRIDPQVPRDEQFDAIRSLLDEGVIRYAGLSEVAIVDIEDAEKFFPVATVQNRYNLIDRTNDAVLDYCTKHEIGFIPWHPLAAGDLLMPRAALSSVAKRHGATPAQVALAWLLMRSPIIIPIPGTSRIDHLEQNVAAAGLELSREDFEAIDSEALAVSS